MQARRRGGRFGALGGRSWREWTARGMLALAALLLGIASVSDTLANVVVKSQAGLAHSLSLGDGRIAAALAKENFTSSPTSVEESYPARLAREALQSDATAVDALTVLGLQAQLRNDDERTDELFAYSTALSRRELQPQLWAIEEAVARGDIEGALDNYDVAFRTSRRAREMLFPILARAISEPRVRGPLLDTLASGAVWREEFIEFAAKGSSEPRAVAQFLQAGTLRNLPIENDDRALVVTRLMARNEIEDAWNFYQEFRPRAQRNRVRDPAFELSIDVPAPFDWNVGETPGLSAAVFAKEGGGVLDFSVPAGTRATVASQTQLLPPGHYRLEGRSNSIDQPDSSRPYWSLACRDGRELGRVDIPDSDRTEGQFSGSFAVPGGCPVQILSLVARSSDNVSGVSGQIERVQLAPAEGEI